ncbi:MAG: arginase family protein [Desulfobacterales bacterium]|nr:arginase family protein [Desulfobacterales bacterium]
MQLPRLSLIKKTDSAVSRYLKDNKLVVTLGGEHSVSIGVIKAYAKHYQESKRIAS